MRLVEYRIFMPLTLEENLIGQIWSFSEVSRMNTGGGEGVEILENTFFELPKDADGRIIYKQLPDYEDYEKQKSNSKSSAVKKSPSKENFSALAAKKILPHSESFATDANNPPTLVPTSPGMHKSVSESVNLSNGTNYTNGSPAASDSDSDTLESNVMSASSNPTKDVQTLHQTRKGQYTHKLYKLASKVPWFVRKLLPKDSTVVHEKSWNMYPCVKTVLTNEYFRGSFRIELDTITRECPNGVAEENVHNLTKEQLEKREIININIADVLTGPLYKQDEDPALFKSIKNGRGPLTKDWITSTTPMICCYKLVFVEFKVFGLQTRSENYLVGMYKQLFTVFHRQIFCWTDKWYDMTLEDVRKIEEDLAKELLAKIGQGEISKCQIAESD